ncbi:hypothetical protein, partial [Paludisphaera soli]|uniref:hypothetical protein n=1 Tax=Paludisphaera soli TaxID=2712865 RepID=UPI0013ECA24D
MGNAGRGAAGRPRRCRARVSRLELLEGRIVLDASASIDAAGLLTVAIPGSASMSRIEVSVSDGDYLLTTGSGSYDEFRLVANDAGLATVGDGTGSFRVRGITGLAFDAAQDMTILVFSSAVPTRFDVRSDAFQVILGGGYGTNGLKDVTGPVVFEVAELDGQSPSRRARLVLDDSGSSQAAEYTITSDAVAATGGFGGVTFARIDDLVVEGPAASEGTTRFDVRSTHSGSVQLSAPSSWRVVFDVDADVAPDERPPYHPWESGGNRPWWDDVLVLSGGGATTYNIKRTPSRISIGNLNGDGVVNLTRDGSTAEIRHDVTISPLAGGVGWDEYWRGRIVIDDSAGTVARDARFFVSPVNPFSYYFHPRLSTLAGVTGEGASLRIDLAQDFGGEIVYKAPRGLGNALEIDLAVYGPLPLGADGKLIYDGGWTGPGDPASRLTLVDRPRTEGPAPPPPLPFSREDHVATGPGSGVIAFSARVAFSPRPWGAVAYEGLSPGSIVDLVPIEQYYTFDYQGAADPGFLVAAGPPTEGGEGTLLIGSRADRPTFVATTIANKADVVIMTRGAGDLASRVDYASEAPVAGLDSLTIVTSGNDPVDVIAAPPGVEVQRILDRYAPPRASGGDGPGEAEEPPAPIAAARRSRIR